MTGRGFSLISASVAGNQTAKMRTGILVQNRKISLIQYVVKDETSVNNSIREYNIPLNVEIRML